MSLVTIYDYEVEGNLLPSTCMICGEPTECSIDKKLFHLGSFLWFTLPVNPISWLLIASGKAQSRRFKVPCCQRHQSYWSKRLLIMLLVMPAIAAAGMFHYYICQTRPFPRDLNWDLERLLGGFKIVAGIGILIMHEMTIRIYRVGETSKGKNDPDDELVFENQWFELIGAHEMFIASLCQERRNRNHFHPDREFTRYEKPLDSETLDYEDLDDD